MDATVRKHVEVRPGEAMVYQRHSLEGGSGRLPLGHHAMLDADPPLRLAFSRRIFAGTPPAPVEATPAGRSILAYPQEIADLTKAGLAGGGTADLTHYPFAEGHEDIWGLVSDPGLPFAWTAATSPSGWVWFALKDPLVLPMTLLWLSNGGRTYAPWSGRHRRSIGVEEIRSNFHLGHAASIADNPLSARHVPTAAELGHDRPFVVSYAFGLAAAPPDFGPVADIAAATGGVTITTAAGASVFAPCDAGFVAS